MMVAILVSFVLSPIAQGESMIVLDVDGKPIETFVYRPAKVERVILVMHGTLRNADEYRDHSESMGDRFNAVIVAPKFDSTRFPSLRYQRGGILKADGSAAKPEEWTYAFIPKIAREVKRRLPGTLKHWIIGHSAGGQFVDRMTAFQDTGAERLVAANAGSLIYPTMSAPFGYGFGNLPTELANENRIRQYLAAPLTMYQGTADNVPDENFDQSAEAMKQGGGRWQRGKGCFEAGKKLAAEKGWKFGWRYVEAKGVGHDHGRMFDHPSCAVALFGMSESALRFVSK